MVHRKEKHTIDWGVALSLVRAWESTGTMCQSTIDRGENVRLIFKEVENHYGNLFGVALRISEPGDTSGKSRRIAAWEEHLNDFGKLPFSDDQIVCNLKRIYFEALDEVPGHPYASPGEVEGRRGAPGGAGGAGGIGGVVELFKYR